MCDPACPLIIIHYCISPAKDDNIDVLLSHAVCKPSSVIGLELGRQKNHVK